MQCEKKCKTKIYARKPKMETKNTLKNTCRWLDKKQNFVYELIHVKIVVTFKVIKTIRIDGAKMSNICLSITY